MLSFFAWYLVISLLGWLSFPLAYRLFPALADRGFSLSRAIGLLLWGYIFWLMASLQIIRNDFGGLVLALFLLTGFCAAALLRKTETNGLSLDFQSLRDWLRSNRRLVIMEEVLFFLAFTVWAFVRASNPNIETAGGEKTMELAFINAILHSPTFPPHDPWLSGYAISYYYFGYVMAAMLARVTATLGSVAHNLMSALVFALSLSGAYGVLYNLLAAWRSRPSSKGKPSIGLPLLGPFFLLFVSNLEGFLEVLHRQGLFWKLNPDGTASSSFWSWLGIPHLNSPPVPPLGWVPNRFIWWWQASRVIQDKFSNEMIDEFPAFSYLLGDLHPHVLAMPFGLLAVATALNVFLGGWRANPEEWRVNINFRTWAWVGSAIGLSGLGSLGFGIYKIYGVIHQSVSNSQIGTGAILGIVLLFILGILLIWFGLFVLSDFAHLGELGARVFVESGLGERPITPPIHLSRSGFLASALILGGLAFLNAWDILVGFALFIGAYALARAQEAGWTWKRLEEILVLGLPTGLLAILLYLPFYVGFSSQAGGFLPNLDDPTRGAQLWVMFAPLFLALIAYLVYLWRREKFPANWKIGILAAIGVILLLWVLSWAFGLVIYLLKPDLAGAYLDAQCGGTIAGCFSQALRHRIINIGGLLTLLVLLGMALSYLVKVETRRKDAERSRSLAIGSPTHFAVMLILVGALLVLVPEFIFLRDLFMSRLNTIFKFYYQAWLVWSLAAAFGVAVMLQRLHGPWAWAYRIGLVLILSASLVYPLLGLPAKTDDFQIPAFNQALQAARSAGDPSPLRTAARVWTLDGAVRLAQTYPDDAAAARWLAAAPDGVIVEAASRDAYSEFGRMAAYSGQPTVLGWWWHEYQWRGSVNEQVSPLQTLTCRAGFSYDSRRMRSDDISCLYETSKWDIASKVLAQYNIRYVVVGTLERQVYHVDELKFQDHLIQVFKSGDVVIYEVPTQADMLK